MENVLTQVAEKVEVLFAHIECIIEAWVAYPPTGRFDWASLHNGFCYFAVCFHSVRQDCQSSRVHLNMALAALWSQRPRRAARSRLILGMAWGEPKCMLAVSQPMQ